MSYEDDRTHKRWVAKLGLNRSTSEADYQEAWHWEQCGGCWFFHPLQDPLNDWGACSNPDSPFDSTLRFEHDGCDHFVKDLTGRAPFS